MVETRPTEYAESLGMWYKKKRGIKAIPNLKFLAWATGSMVLPSTEGIKLCGHIWERET